MKDKKKIFIVASIIILLGFVFYWYSYRPSQIVQTCSVEAREKAVKKADSDGKYSKDDRDAYYKWCLEEKGLVK